MLKRIITGGLLTAVIVGFFFLRKIDTRLFDILLYIVSIFGTYEILRAFGERITKTEKVAGMVFTLVSLPLFVFFDLKLSLPILVTIFFVLVVISLFKAKESFESVGCTMLSLIYPTVPMLVISFVNDKFSIELSLFTLIVIFISGSLTDVFAFFVGSALKGKKLCPTISPKKTISGAIGGLIGGIVGCFIAYFFTKAIGKEVFQSIDLWLVIIILFVLGVFAAVADEVGDLFESLIKRKVGIKDMGNILPGHGGIMDRFDGISLVAIVSFIVIYVFEILIG